MASHTITTRKQQLLSMNKEQLIGIILEREHNDDIQTQNIHQKRKFSSLHTPSNHTNNNNNDIKEPPTKKHKTCTSKSNKTTKKKKKKSVFDMNRYHQRHIALKLAYLGTNYDGFVHQQNSQNTIEEHLFAALMKTCLITDINECNYTRCGRTDKGVSSLGNVISLTVRSNLKYGKGFVTRNDDEANTEHKYDDADNISNELGYVDMMNNVLPFDIRILSWSPVDINFNSRFLCNYREYKYLFYANGMDIDSMKKGAKLLIGTHDFRNFCKMDVVNVNNFVRQIMDITIQRMEQNNGFDELWCIDVKGSAFLWHQIRFMMTVLFMIGNGNETYDVIEYLLDIDTCDGKPQYLMASDKPLILYDCVFDDKDVVFDAYYANNWTQCMDTFGIWHQIWREQNVISQVSKIFWNKCVDMMRDEETDKIYKGLTQLDLPLSKKKNKRQRAIYVKMMDRVKELSYQQRVETLANSKLRKYNEKQKQREFFKNK